MKMFLFYCGCLVLLAVFYSCNRNLSRQQLSRVEDKVKFELVVNIYEKVLGIYASSMNFWANEIDSEAESLRESARVGRNAISVFDDVMDAVRAMQKETGNSYYDTLRDYIRVHDGSAFAKRVLNYYQSVNLELDECVKVGDNRYKIHDQKSNAVCFLSFVNGKEVMVVDLSNAKGKLDLTSDKIVFEY